MNTSEKGLEPRIHGWRVLANLGDVDPIECGGFFVLHPPEREGSLTEIEILEEPTQDPPYDGEPDTRVWTVYRLLNDRIFRLTDKDPEYPAGALGDNVYHPYLAVWFSDKVPEVARFIGYADDGEELRDLLCSADPIDRAAGYQSLVAYFGPYEFDQYPRTLTAAEVQERYREVQP